MRDSHSIDGCLPFSTSERQSQPDTVPDPDRENGFEWNFGKSRLHAAIAYSTHNIASEGVFGTVNKTHSPPSPDTKAAIRPARALHLDQDSPSAIQLSDRHHLD